MSLFLIAFLSAFLLPIFTGSWRSGLLGLGAQTLIMAFFAYETHAGTDFDLSWLLQIADLAILRSFVVPAILIFELQKLRISRDIDYVPPNFLYWGALLLLIGSGIWFGFLVFPENFDQSLLCGTAAAGFLTAFFVLSLQPPGFGQIFAVLLLENSIVLFEFLAHPRLEFVWQVTASLIYLALFLVIRTFLRHLADLTPSDDEVRDRDFI